MLNKEWQQCDGYDMGVFHLIWAAALSIARGMETATTSNRNETHLYDILQFDQDVQRRPSRVLQGGANHSRCHCLGNEAMVVRADAGGIATKSSPGCTCRESAVTVCISASPPVRASTTGKVAISSVSRTMFPQ